MVRTGQTTAYQASIYGISGQAIVKSKTPPTQTATGSLLKLGLAMAKLGRGKSYVVVGIIEILIWLISLLYLAVFG